MRIIIVLLSNDIFKHCEKSPKKRSPSEENIAPSVTKKAKKTKQDIVVVSEGSVQKKENSQHVKLESRNDQEQTSSKKKKKRKNIESTDDISPKSSKTEETELQNDTEAENVPSKRRKKQKDISVVLDRYIFLISEKL